MNHSHPTPTHPALTGLRRLSLACLFALCLPLALPQKVQSAPAQLPPVSVPAPAGSGITGRITPATLPSGPTAPAGQIGGAWTSLGPAPTFNGQPIMPNSPICGAIQGIAAHPTSADILYIGAINGGIWRTANATAANPTWTPLTDNLASLSIGGLEFDPTDATSQTLVASSGRLSSYGGAGGARIGVMRTTDGGNTWATLGTSTFANENLVAVAARGNIILTASDDQWSGGAGSGVFRSVDTGATFQLIPGGSGLTAGPTSDLIGDASNVNRLYAAVRKTGIFRSDDAGVTWVNVTAGITGISSGTAKIKMTVHNSAGNNVLYVGVIDSNNKLGGVWRSVNQGSSWTAMDIPVAHNGSQGQIHFSIVADQTSPTIVYLGGDRILNSPFTGNCFRGDATLASGSQFVSITDGNAGNTAPHADSRRMVLDANGNIIRGDDGGIYRRTAPQSNSGTWGSPIGNLAVMEAHDVAYDSVAKVAMIGAQDNGTQIQSANGSSVWNAIFGGDGGDVAIDDKSTPGRSIRYGSAQNLGGFFRKTFDAGNNLLSTDFPALTVQGGGAAISVQFTTPIVVNKINPLRLIIGGDNSPYESSDRGDTVTELSAGFGVNADFTGKPVSYGGRLAGAPNPDVLYYGSGSSVRLRTTSGGAVAATATAFPGGNVQDIVLDTNDWRRVFVVDSSRVFTSADAGTNWVNITGNLTGVGTLWTLEFFGLNGIDCVVVGTDTGVYLSFVNDLGNWSRFGSGLPNAPVFDLTHSAVDNVLVAATMGRGAFAISTNPNTPPTISPIADQFMMRNTTLGPVAFTVGDAESAPGLLIITGSSANTNLVSNSGIVFGGSGSNRTFTITPATNQAGIVVITITADDGRDTTNRTFILTVADQPPTISAISNQTTLEDVPVTGIAFTIGDPESPASSLTLSATSSNPTLVPNNQIFFGGSSSNRNVSVVPAANQFGTAIITVSVSDSFSSASTQFTLTVNPINDPPTLNAIANLSLKEDPGLRTVTLSGITAGPNETGQTPLTVTAWSDNTTLIPNPTVTYTSPSTTGSLSFTPTANLFGSATLYVVVKDSAGGADSVTNSFLVTISSVNDAPTLDALAPLAINEDAGLQTVNLSGISAGPPEESGQTLTVTATSSNTAIAPNPTVSYNSPDATGSISFTPVANASGSTTITVKVKDNGGTGNTGVDTVTRTFLLTVNAVNDPPTLDTLLPIAIGANAGQQTVNLTGISSGPSNESAQILTITATSDNPGLIPNPTITYVRPNAIGTLKFTPVLNQFGSATIQVVVKDNGGIASGGVDAVTNTFLVTVNSSTIPPTLTQPVNMVINEDSGLRTVNLTGISDGGVGAATLTVTATSSNPSVIPNPVVTYTSFDATGTLEFTPVADKFGTVAISVVVSTGVNSLTRIFQVLVNSVNDAPSFALAGSSTFANSANIDINDDAPGTPYPSTISVSGVPGTVASVTVTLSGLSHTYLGDVGVLLVGPNGEQSLLLRGAGGGGPGVDNVTLTFDQNATNPVPDQPPTGTYLPSENSVQTIAPPPIIFSSNPTDLSAPAPAGPYPLDLSVFNGTNPNGTWSLYVVDEAGGDIGNIANGWSLNIVSSVGSTVVVNEDAGARSLVDFVTNIKPGPANESSQTITFTVSNDNPALFSAPPALTYSPGPATAKLTFTPLTNTSGAALVKIIAQDNGGTANGGVNAFTNTFIIIVNPVNDRPALNAIASFTILEDSALRTVNLSGITAGGDGGVLTITATSDNPGLIPDPTVGYTNANTTGTLTFTPVPNENGTATIMVVVNDSGGIVSGGVEAVTNYFTVTVTAVNDTPTLDQPANLILNEDAGSQDVILTGITAGPGNESAQVLTVTATSNNRNLIPDPIISPIVGLLGPTPDWDLNFTPQANQFGTAVITVTVKDNGGTANGGVDLVMRTFVVTVIPVNDPPKLAALPPLTINEDAGQQTVNLAGILAGPGNEASQVLTVTASSDNPALISSLTVSYISPQTTGNLKFTPVTSANGTATISVIVTDNGGTANGGMNAVTNTFVVTVNPVNDAPTLDGLPPLTINEDAGLQIAGLSGIGAGAPDEVGQTFTVTATSSNPNLIPNPTVNYNQGSQDATGTISFTPVANANGTVTVKVVVTDNGGTANGGKNAVTNQFTVTVNPVNDAPGFTLPAGPGVEGLYGASLGASHLYILNSANGAVITDVGAIGFNVTGLATDPTTGIMYGSTTVGLITVNTATGAGALVGAYGLADLAAVPDLTFGPDGTLYGSGQNVDPFPGPLGFLVTINKSTGAATKVSAATFDPIDGVSMYGEGLAYSSGLIYFAGYGAGGRIGSPLSTINPATGVKTDGPRMDENGYAIGALAVDSAGTLFGVMDDNPTLVTINTTTGHITRLGNSVSQLDAITFGTVPGGTFSMTVAENAGLQTVNLTGIKAGPADEASQGLSITALSSDPSVVPDPLVSYLSPQTSGSLSFTPVAGANGTVTITVVITDTGGTANGGVDSYTNSFDVVISPVNNAPTLGALANLTINEDSGVTTVNLTGISAGPGDESGLPVGVQAFSSDTSVVPNPTVTYFSPQATGSLSFTPTLNGSGTAIIKVVVTDSGQSGSPLTNDFKSVTNYFTVTVNARNDAPTLTAITNPAAILEDAGQQTINLTGISSGAANETQALTITATSSDPSIIPTPTVTYTSPATTGTLRYTPVANANGTATIKVVVTDNGGTANGGVDAVTNTFVVTVTAVNDAPTLGALANLTLNEDPGLQTVNLSGITSGAANETQVLTITATSSDTSVVPNPTVSYTSPNTAGTLTFTPVFNASGTATIKVIVKDDGLTANGGVDAVTNVFTVTVNARNDAPTLTAITNPAAILEDAGQQTINLTGITSGAANETQTLTITATSSDPSIIPTPTVTYISPATTGTLRYTPVANANGTATIKVVVTDNGGTANGGVDAVTNTFVVTVTAVNDAPTLGALANLTLNEDPGLQTVNLSGITSGAANETQVLTITATSSDTSVVPNPTVSYTSPNTTGTLAFTPVFNASGTATIKVIVKDDGLTANGGVDAVTNVFTVTVNSSNDAPLLDPISNIILNEDAGTQTINLTGIGTGAANETQALTITATSSTPSLISDPIISYTSPNATGTLIFTPVANASGIATITVTVKDNGGTTNGGSDTSTRLFLVTITPVNDAPVLAHIPDKIINQGSLLTFTNSATDVEGDTLAFTLVSAPAGAALTASGIFTWTPAVNQSPSTNEITVRVTDNGQSGSPLTNDFKSTSQMFKVIVNPTNTPPRLNQQSVAVNGDYQFTLVGEAGRTYRVEYSTNLLTWTFLYTVVNPDGAVQIVDPGATGNPFRFYRIIRVP